jgi:Cu2+-exporting ATPase
MFRDKFWLSLALTIPVVLWSTDVQHWLGYTAPSFPGSKFIPAVLGTVVFVYGGLVFIRGARSELADHKPGMMTLISLAIIVAFGTSLAATFGLFEVDVWWELASLITIMVLGHWLEMRAISQARGALNALAALLPDTAERVRGAETQTVPLSELRIGDIVLVRPGARVPADGTVVEGAADVDESMITGESKTLPKTAGSKVIAGTVVSGGSLRASGLLQSGIRPLSPESCGSWPPRKRPAPARRHLLTVRPRYFFTSRSPRVPLLSPIGGFQETGNTP